MIKCGYDHICIVMRYIFLVGIFQINGTMQLIVNLEEKFKIDPVSTEWNAYTLLKKEPINEDIVYFAIPWAMLINNGALSRVPNLKLNGGFTICQHTRFEWIIPIMKQLGLDTLFTPHVVKGKRYDVTVLPFPHYAVNGTGPANKKNIFYSFIGHDTHKIRKKLFAGVHPQDSLIKKRKNWHFWSENQQQEKKEYQNVLARSRYSLCPPGFGPSTLRFWESLQAGAIPVLIGDEMWLPEPFDWSSCTVVIKEAEIEQIATILRAISPDREAYMRKMSLLAFKMFSNDNFVSTIRYHYRNSEKTKHIYQQ
jgi:hypothetical protein